MEKLTRAELKQLGPSHPDWDPRLCGRKKTGGGGYCVGWRRRRADGTLNKWCYYHTSFELKKANTRAIRYGETAYILREEVCAKFNVIKKRTDLLDLDEELALFRTYLSLGIEKWQELAQEDDFKAFEEISWVMSTIERLSKLVETIVGIRNDTALTVAEIHYVQLSLAKVLKKYLEPERLREVVEEIFKITSMDKQTKLDVHTDTVIDGVVVKKESGLSPEFQYILNDKAILGEAC